MINNRSDKRVLTNRQWHVNGSWYASLKFLRENFSSVVHCDFMEMTSSAGNWSGLIIQKLGKKLFATVFSQENCYQNAGFDITTSEHPIAELPVKGKENYAELFETLTAIIYDINFN